MDVNEYLCERMVRDRLSEARARAATAAVLEAVRPRRPLIRYMVGSAFVKFGHWVLADPRMGDDPGSPGRPATSRLGAA